MTTFFLTTVLPGLRSFASGHGIVSQQDLVSSFRVLQKSLWVL